MSSPWSLVIRAGETLFTAGRRRPFLVIGHEDAGIRVRILEGREKREVVLRYDRLEAILEVASRDGSPPSPLHKGTLRLLRAAGVSQDSSNEGQYWGVVQAFRSHEPQGAASPVPGRALGGLEPGSHAAPDEPPRRRGFGRGLSPEQIKRVELHAMQAALNYFAQLGYSTDDVSARESYDIRATKGAEVVQVEVKGTTGAYDRVVLTRNEVELARRAYCALFVVCDIRLSASGDATISGSGVARVISPWMPLDQDLYATEYRYRLPVGAKLVGSVE